MAQEGFLYESNAYKALQKYKISTGGVAGASHDKPDLTIKAPRNKKGGTAGCELKNSPTAAGSLVMKYYQSKWSFGAWEGEPEKEFLHALADKFGLLKEMNEAGGHGLRWRGKTPCLQNDETGKKIFIGAKDGRDAYAKDIAKFGGPNEVHIPIPTSAICEYYVTKNCSYLNVGTHGFFTLNGKDVLGLNKNLKSNGLGSIPDFSNSAKAMIRVRCQDKGGGSYQFVMTLQFGEVQKSPYNIAPIRKGSKADIDLNALQKDQILLAFT